MLDFAVLVAGSGPDERPEDVVYLCDRMAYQLYRSRLGPDDDDMRELRRAFIDVGKILCLIFDMVKPPEYQMEMRKVRRGYRGIAHDPHLQKLYSRQVRRALATGALDDVRSAVRLGLPAILAVPLDEPVPAW